jgi:hypothetical protein
MRGKLVQAKEGLQRRRAGLCFLYGRTAEATIAEFGKSSLPFQQQRKGAPEP